MTIFPSNTSLHASGTRFLRALLVCVLAAAIGVSAPAAARRSTSSPITVKDKEKAENEKADIEHKLQDLKSALQEKESQKEAVNSEIQKADTAISEANRKLRKLEQDRRRIEREILSLRRNESSVGKDLTQAESTLELISKTQFITLQKPTWQAIINGQNPHQVYRDSAMLSYLARAQQQALLTLGNQREQIRSVKQSTLSQQEELLKIKRQEEEQRQILVKEKRERQVAVKKLGDEIQSQQNQIGRLEKDQQRLSNLVSSIEKKLKQQAEEQRKREIAERKERERLERLRQEEAKRKQASRTEVEETPVHTAKAPDTPTRALPGLKGRLLKPVNGRLVARYGSKRPGGRGTWQGVQFEAPEGTDVQACADGRIVFADWLRGYGNLIIIDHGKGYLSVYGNNETLYKDVGEYVKQGETISAVGSSGGNTEPGLYFELRHNGKPMNPTPWISP